MLAALWMAVAGTVTAAGKELYGVLLLDGEALYILFENMVKKYAMVAAPLKKRISPHKLRSTFGTNLYQETGDIYLVADVLGHADVNTTRKHYAAMTDAHKREAARRVILPQTEKPEDE